MIFARAVLEPLGGGERRVWCADSFAGLPRPDPESTRPTWRRPPHLPPARGPARGGAGELRALRPLDDRSGSSGWFRDTLPSAPIETLSVLRLDGDMYESTIVALRALYPKLAPGGYAIVDDYGAAPACRRAVEDFRAEQGVDEPLREIDWTGMYWRRAG
jgi:O-methyltransferase